MLQQFFEISTMPEHVAVYLACTTVEVKALHKKKYEQGFPPGGA